MPIQTQTQTQTRTRKSREKKSGGSNGSVYRQTSSQLENDIHPSYNIMYDPRIIRGNTHALRKQIENRMSSVQSNSNKNLSRKNSKYQSNRINKRQTNTINNNSISNAATISGRVNMQIQTEQYIEEISVITEEKTSGTQTDPFMDYPSTPLFVSQLSGPSIATQIEDGDLFDFNNEIEPILEVLIGKSVEEGLMEVLEEEELKKIKYIKQQFEQKRNIEISKCQQLEFKEKRRIQEKQRRLKQQKEYKKQKKILQNRIKARQIAIELMKKFEENALNELDNRGYFNDPVRKEVRNKFMNQLLSSINNKILENDISNQIIDKSINIVTKNLYNKSNKSVKLLKKKEIFNKIKTKILLQQEQLFNKKRSEFTQSIKSQLQDFDIKKQISLFTDLATKVEKPESTADDENKDDNDNDDNNNDNNDDEEAEIPPEIQSNIEFIDQIIETSSEEPLWKIIKQLIDKLDNQYDSNSFQCNDKTILEQIDQMMKIVNKNDNDKDPDDEDQDDNNNDNNDDNNDDDNDNNEKKESETKKSDFDLTELLNNIQLFKIFRMNDYLSTHYLIKKYKKKLIECFSFYKGDELSIEMKQSIIDFLNITDITVFDEPQQTEEQEEEQEQETQDDENPENPENTENENEKEKEKEELEKPVYNPIYSQIFEGLQSDEQEELFKIITKLIKLKMEILGSTDILSNDMLTSIDEFVNKKFNEREAKKEKENQENATEEQENEDE